MIVIVVVAILLVGAALLSVRVLREYERAVVFRLGRLLPVKGPWAGAAGPGGRPDGAGGPADGDAHRATAGGDHARQRAGPRGRRLLLPRGRPRRGDHRDRSLRAGHVPDRPDHAALGARRADLDQLLAERDRLNEDLQKIIDEQTEPWGIKVSTVEIKDVEIPEAMQRAMARQAEAERERRAKVINAEGEFQAAEKLAAAAEIIGREPSALQLRYLQTLLEVGADQNSTIVFPLPLDLLKPFLERTGLDPDSLGGERALDELARLGDRPEP